MRSKSHNSVNRETNILERQMKGTKHKRKTLPEQSLIINYRLKEEDVIIGERELLPLGRVKSLEAGLRKRK